MKYQMNFMNFKINDRSEFETYLNEKSKSGWNLVFFNELFVVLKKDNIRKHYYVDLNSNMKYLAFRKIDSDTQKIVDFYKEYGYDLCTAYQYFIIYTSNEKLENLHTDDEVESLLIEKVNLQKKWMRIIIPLALSIISILSFIGNYRIRLLLYSNNWAILLIILFFIITICFSLFEYYNGRYKKISFAKNIRNIHYRSISVVIFYLFLFIYSLFIFNQIDNSRLHLLDVLCCFFATWLGRILFINILSTNKNNRKSLLIISFLTLSFIYLGIEFLIISKDFYSLEPSNSFKQQQSIALYSEEKIVRDQSGNGYSYRYYNIPYSWIHTDIINSEIDEAYKKQTFGNIEVYKHFIPAPILDNFEDLTNEFYFIDQSHILHIQFSTDHQLTNDELEKIVQQLPW